VGIAGHTEPRPRGSAIARPSTPSRSRLGPDRNYQLALLTEEDLRLPANLQRPAEENWSVTSRETAMPLGYCDRCDRMFVIESASSPQRTCPQCFRPMRLAAREEGFGRLRHPNPSLQEPSPADEVSGTAGSAEPRVMTELEQRARAALAVSAATCTDARECQEQARRLRSRLAEAREQRPSPLTAQPRSGRKAGGPKKFGKGKSNASEEPPETSVPGGQ
jgi:hypothetical protein